VLELNWRPSASREMLLLRADVLKKIRDFFYARNVSEVETPVLSQAAVTDLQLKSLTTRITGQAINAYLQTSPEYPMKRLLAAHQLDIYQICKAFRDDEVSRFHNPEFTIVEWYRLGFDHHALMDEVEELLSLLLAPRLNIAAERITYAHAFERTLQIDPLQAPLSDLHAIAVERLGANSSSLGTERDTVLDLLMGALVGPTLGDKRISFVHSYPASQAALARLLPTDARLAARFEAYFCGVELCNGFHELSDAKEQTARFEHDLVERRRHGLHEPPLDARMLGALAAGLPYTAGVAVGLDRVLMLAADKGHISEVLNFAVDNA